MIKNCLKCKKIFTPIKSNLNKGYGIYCSRDCYKNRVKINCKECSKVFEVCISAVKKGKKFCSQECYSKWQSKNRIGENAYSWKGDSVGYWGVHAWIEKKLGKAFQHVCMLADKTCKGKMNWSNISRKYLRDISDWQILCQSHHFRYDVTDEWKKNMSEAHKR